MPLASSRRLRRLLVGSGGPRSRCNRRRKSCVRIRNGSAFSARDSIKQTAGLAGRAGKKSSSARAGSKPRPQSSSSTVTGYNGTEARVRVGGGDTPPPVFFVRVANTGLMLDAASRIVTKGDRGTVAGVERRVPNGAADEWARVDFGWSDERAQVEVCATGPPPGVFCAKSAEIFEIKRVTILRSAKECARV